MKSTAQSRQHLAPASDATWLAAGGQTANLVLGVRTAGQAEKQGVRLLSHLGTRQLVSMIGSRDKELGHPQRETFATELGSLRLPSSEEDQTLSAPKYPEASLPRVPRRGLVENLRGSPTSRRPLVRRTRKQRQHARHQPCALAHLVDGPINLKNFGLRRPCVQLDGLLGL
eukprot:3071391-Pyramimonas_sp.AAC.1